MTTNKEKHLEIMVGLNEMYAYKNEKYGDSFANTVRKYGDIAALTRMADKWERIENMIVNKTDDKEESLKDSLLDLANYCAMFVMILDER